MDPYDPAYTAEMAENTRNAIIVQRSIIFRGEDNPPPLTRRGQIIMKFNLQELADFPRLAPLGRIYLTDILPASRYPPCNKPLSELKKIMIDELLPNTHLKGSYMILRAITNTRRVAGMFVVVEDEKNRAIQLKLCHHVSDFENPGIPTERRDQIIAKDMVVIVKEPCLQATPDGHNGLRVDHIGNIMFLDPFDERIPREWRVDREGFAETIPDPFPMPTIHKAGGARLSYKTLPTTVRDWNDVANSHFKKDKYQLAITL